VKFNCDNFNIFSVFSRAGKGNRESKNKGEGVEGGLMGEGVRREVWWGEEGGCAG